MTLTTTQIGAIAENLIANELMVESGGRLSPFQPIADDDGIDVLIYDKVTGNAIPIQVKARTNTLLKANSLGRERGNTAHFEVKKSTHNGERQVQLLCVLLRPDLKGVERAWLLPLHELEQLSNVKKDKYVIRANKQLSTNDRFKEFQCKDVSEVSQRLINIVDICEA